VLAPVAAIRKDLLQGSYLQADETVVQVHGQLKRSNHQAYLWQ